MTYRPANHDANCSPPKNARSRSSRPPCFWRESSPALITTADIATAIGVTQARCSSTSPPRTPSGWPPSAGARNPAAEASGRGGRVRHPPDALAAMFGAHVEFVAAHPGVPSCSSSTNCSNLPTGGQSLRCGVLQATAAVARPTGQFGSPGQLVMPDLTEGRRHQLHRADPGPRHAIDADRPTRRHGQQASRVRALPARHLGGTMKAASLDRAGCARRGLHPLLVAVTCGRALRAVGAYACHGPQVAEGQPTPQLFGIGTVEARRSSTDRPHHGRPGAGGGRRCGRRRESPASCWPRWTRWTSTNARCARRPVARAGSAMAAAAGAAPDALARRELAAQRAPPRELGGRTSSAPAPSEARLQEQASADARSPQPTPTCRRPAGSAAPRPSAPGIRQQRANVRLLAPIRRCRRPRCRARLHGRRRQAGAAA